MTRRRKRQPNNKPPFLLISGIVVGVLLIAAAGFFFTRRGADSGGTPVIRVDPQAIDYGYVKLGTNKTFKIKVTNNGDGVLKFKEKPFIQVLEGC